ncbi:MAG: FlaD/FlaE family flagellar protein, partial [Halovenus sp.]
DELEHRLDELENEVGSLSSTVNTVRNENEQISNSVEEVEENVRKLLDIYEMVTRGVNPFADEMDAGMGMGGGGMDAQDGSFGLFTDDEQESQDESVDEDIADADAEGFFDDDLVDDEPDMGDEMGMDADADEGGDDSEDSGGGGTSFEDLKNEYESGEADWDEDGETDDAASEFEDVGGEFDELDDGDEFADDAASEFDDAGGEFEDVGDEIADDEMFDETLETDEPAAESEPTTEETVQTSEPTPETTVETAEQSVETHQNGSTAHSTGGKPYIATVPEGFAADLIVVEWLEFLVEEAGVRETAKALNYYESVDWISEEAADDLEAYLNGFEDTRRGALMIDHHKQSLEFINQLNGGTVSGLNGVTGVTR